ncbi:MAG: hypothetical protein LBM08_11935 [Dysgonamonadaceae bacterium]|jgi:hypothetical protein|nr:hypothetical protein [Dysgonamonadaceae bacterium]
MAQTKHPGRDSLHHAQPKESFYDRNSSSKWIRELKNVIVVSPKTESVADSFNIQSPSNIYIGTEGRTITRIRIVRMKPFGSSLTDTSAHHITWLGKVGNAVHISTSEFIIRNALLFNEGDTVNSFKLADSERYLRALRYIDDACVVAVPISDDEVEVIVAVQDILPYSLSFGTNFSSRANFALTNCNILGMGIEMRTGAFIDSQEDHLMGYEAMLRLPNIGRSFISIQADYLDRYENQRYGFTLSRDFYAPTTRYAGHLILYNARTPVRYCDPKGNYPEVTAITVRYNHLDAWLGRSFQIDKKPFNKQRNNITLSIGAQRISFVDRPENSEESYYKFQNRTTYLASLTYSQQAHYKTNLIYNFGRTEDIPYGYLLSIVGGREVNEMYNRPYIGTNVSSGYFIPKLGYLSGAVSYGTFFRKGTDQGVIDFELNYFTNLYILGNFRQRTFVNGQYTRQLYNKLDDQLVIDGDFGIPGFRNDSVLGRHRFNLSVEQDLFTPWDLYGFKFVLYVFANFSWLGGYDKPIMLSPLYSSFGLGVRIRNNRLIFNTLQIRFAYFPNIPENSRFRYIHPSKETVLQPRDFKPNAPDIMPLY